LLGLGGVASDLSPTAAAPDRSAPADLRAIVGVVGEVDARITDASDFDIFCVPSRSDITRVGAVISGSGCGKEQSILKTVAADRSAGSVIC
jgi:hypothetical protein